MNIVLLTQCIASSYEIAGAALRGLGYSMLPAILTVFGTCVIIVDISCLSVIAQFRCIDGDLSYFVDRDRCCRPGGLLRDTEKVIPAQRNTDFCLIR